MSPNRSALLCCASLLFVAVAACSAESEPANADLTATLPDDAAAKDEMSELDRLANQNHEAFLATCRQGGLPSQDGQASSSEDCAKAYQRAQSASEAAQILSDAFLPNGAASATSLDDIRSRLSRINWTEEMTGGSTIASGKLGDFNATVSQRNSRQHLSFNWSGPAGDVPVNIADALALKGAKLQMVACHTGSLDETGRVWRVTPRQGDAFDLTTFTRVGPSGTAISSHSGSVALDRNITTLDTLRAQDSDWSVCG